MENRENVTRYISVASTVADLKVELNQVMNWCLKCDLGSLKYKVWKLDHFGLSDLSDNCCLVVLTIEELWIHRSRCFNGETEQEIHIDAWTSKHTNHLPCT